MIRPAPLAVLALVLLGGGAIGCGGSDPAPAPAPETAPAPAPTAIDPAKGSPAATAAAAATEPGQPAPPRAKAPPPAAGRRGGEPSGYGEAIRRGLRAGHASVVRQSLPPGAVAAVGAFRRALVRAEPQERAAALQAVSTLADLIERQGTFLAATEAVQQGSTPGVRLPGWVAPALRAIAAGPAASADPATLTDAELIDGTVAELLKDPTFQRGLERWTVAEDVPLKPPESNADEPGQETVDVVTLRNPEGEEASIPVVASEGAWAPAILEATAPIWAAKADSAGGTGAAAVLAAAGPHLDAALAAKTQAAFDQALREATDAALAAAADPPAPVPDAQRVTVEFTRPLTARQAADLLALLESVTDDPARAVSRAAPRANGPGWRVTVGPVADVAAWLARVPPLAGAAVEGRTVTIAYEPPPAEPAPGGEAGGGVESGERAGAD
ncbi:hypothetical protein [Alienimonas californiensis]|uniref:Uncharacterized protein n=1 Tax=Alienimonas californiensis TaxID=2527989 RepID=A0A517PE89_9PLAN|nr:hypothetical protein [Alienimonas californiensis]QDT17678.1 hypothetical protein CA12_38090 [Alienimonas californiensis]